MVQHVVHVHLSVSDYSKDFQTKLRRVNHVTPKNYLDFINSYTKLLSEKDKFVQDQVHCTVQYSSTVTVNWMRVGSNCMMTVLCCIVLYYSVSVWVAV